MEIFELIFLASMNSAENQNNENLQRENGNEESNKSEETGKKKKSKKRKLPSEPETSTANNEENSEEEKGQETTEKVLKKRKIESTKEEEKVDEKMDADENEIITIKKAKNDLSKFDWKQAINEIMAKRSKDGRLSVRKLQKKVVGRYLHSHYTMTKEEAISRFDRILRHMKNYKIENEVVNIVQS